MRPLLFIKSFSRFLILLLIVQLSVGLFVFPVNKAKAAGTTYYVDNTCTYNGNGLAQTCAASAGVAGPFNSLASALSTVTGNQAGNSLLLKAGETFREQATIAAYGTSAGEFTIGSYGTGALPVITGANLLSSGWTQTTTGGTNTITASPATASDTVYGS
jgi:hypothetical protein